MLADARNTIHDLETKLGHERLANDDAAYRTSAEKRQIDEALTVVQEELATERAMRVRKGNVTRLSLPRRPPNSGCGSGRRSKERCHLQHLFPAISPHGGAAGLRR